jgi:glycosyltransferase involved in cell wall biosynthesis
MIQMHIVVMSRILPTHALGGMQKQCMDLCDGFTKNGHRVTILTTAHQDGIATEIIDDINIHYLSPSQPERYSRGWSRACKLKISEIHSEAPIDIIHSQSLGARGVLRWADKQNIPVVSTWHGTSLTEISTFFSSARKSPRYWHWLLLMPVIFLRQYIFMDLPTRRSSDAITLVSPTLEKNMKLFAKNKVHVIANGIDIPEKVPARDNRETLHLLCLGRIEKEKGMHHAVKAIAGFKTENVKLDVVGTGPYLDELKLLISKLGIDDMVSCHGRVNDDELSELFTLADIYLMPTTRQEGLPLTILEAMANGLPVIASDIGGISGVIKDDEDGVLVKPGDVTELVGAIRLLKNDDGKRLRISAAARKTIEDRYSKERMVDETLAVFSSVMQGVKQ